MTDYIVEYPIEVNHGGVTAIDVRKAIDKSLGLEDTSGLQIPDRKFALGVAYDLLQIGAGYEGEEREKHIRTVRETGIEAVTDLDILLRVEPLTANPEDSEKYTSMIIRVTEQGAELVTPEVMEAVINELGSE